MAKGSADRAAIESVYQQKLPSYEALHDEVLFMLSSGLSSAGLKVHSLTARVKTLKSLIEKVERKNYVDPYVEAEDLVGCRVVCLFQSDLARAREVVDSTFNIIREEDKVADTPADTFGYMSTHLICQIKQEHSGPRYDSIKDLTFEVQMRTIVMDAWASVSHHLAYKGDASIPRELRRDFYALSGLFYVADQHFELFFKNSVGAQEATLAAVGRSAQESLQAVPIDRDTIMGLLRRLYPDRRATDKDSASEFAEEVAAAGYHDLGDLQEQLERAGEAALAYEERHPPGGEDSSGHFADVGIARQALAIADPAYAAWKYEDDDSFEDFREGLRGGPPRRARGFSAES